MKWIKYLILIIILAIIAINFDLITSKISEMLRQETKVVIEKPNKYYKNSSFNYVKLSEDFIPYSKQDLMDIFYSILNSGYNTFTFYCPKEYEDCLNDVNALSSDQETLTYINNFVSPYNSFSNIKIIYSTSGEVNVEVSKLYSEDEILSLNNKISEISKNILNDEMKLEDKILAIHDYIINNTRYDEKRISNNSTYNSNKANGALMEGYAVCSGYADAMAIFLNNLGVDNFKISSKTHVWNAVYLNDKWLHLDLTWDDPVTINSDTQTLSHKFYLIDTKSLDAYKISDHEFDKSIYSELK